jgi:hypothetical protein
MVEEFADLWKWTRSTSQQTKHNNKKAGSAGMDEWEGGEVGERVPLDSKQASLEEENWDGGDGTKYFRSNYAGEMMNDEGRLLMGNVQWNGHGQQNRREMGEPGPVALSGWLAKSTTQKPILLFCQRRPGMSASN